VGTELGPHATSAPLKGAIVMPSAQRERGDLWGGPALSGGLTR
jgi:hypothetical protein